RPLVQTGGLAEGLFGVLGPAELRQEAGEPRVFVSKSKDDVCIRWRPVRQPLPYRQGRAEVLLRLRGLAALLERLPQRNVAIRQPVPVIDRGGGVGGQPLVVGQGAAEECCRRRLP